MSTITKRLEKIEQLIKASKKSEDYSHFRFLSKEELEKLIEKRKRAFDKNPKIIEWRKKWEAMSSLEVQEYIEKRLRKIKQSAYGM